MWGGTEGEFYSGEGSDELFAVPYAAAIRSLIENEQLKSVIDIGCGDFRVGRLITDTPVRYLGVDVVSSLVERNVKLHSSRLVSFRCLDAVTDELPAADLCLIRQVLQHLSNAEIFRVLNNVKKKFRNVVITEHLPAQGMETCSNLDMSHGWGIRVFRRSGVYPHLPPFNFGVMQVLLDIDLPDAGGRLVTMLFRNSETTGCD